MRRCQVCIVSPAKVLSSWKVKCYVDLSEQTCIRRLLPSSFMQFWAVTSQMQGLNLFHMLESSSSQPLVQRGFEPTTCFGTLEWWGCWHMSIDAFVVPKFQSSWPLTVACWADNARMILNINSFAHVQWMRTTQTQINLCTIKSLLDLQALNFCSAKGAWICYSFWNFGRRTHEH